MENNEREAWAESCLFRPGVQCRAEDEPRCHACGWCPNVEAARRFALRKRLGATIVTVREEENDAVQ